MSGASLLGAIFGASAASDKVVEFVDGKRKELK